MAQIIEKDFSKNKFDGTPKDTYKFLHFFKQKLKLKLKLKLKKIGYLLDITEYPTPFYPKSAYHRRSGERYDLQDLKSIESYEVKRTKMFNDAT